MLPEITTEVVTTTEALIITSIEPVEETSQDIQTTTATEKTLRNVKIRLSQKSRQTSSSSVPKISFPILLFCIFYFS